MKAAFIFCLFSVLSFAKNSDYKISNEPNRIVASETDTKKRIVQIVSAQFDIAEDCGDGLSAPDRERCGAEVIDLKKTSAKVIVAKVKYIVPQASCYAKIKITSQGHNVDIIRIEHGDCIAGE